MARLSQERIAQLFHGSHTELARFLSRRLPDEEASKDLAQEAFLRLIRMQKCEHIQSLEAYLFRIAANLVSEYWSSGRNRTNMANEPTDFDSLPAEQSTQEELLAQKQELETLQKALSLLPEIQQQVVIMHRRDGLTYEEIGEKLGISRDMVKKHLTRALVRCREYLKLSQVP